MSVLTRLWLTLVGIARELSDESAYARHLAYTGRPHSNAEWRTFSDARLRRKYQQGKCC
ncbi:MAG TPA: hypothetical protein VN737_04035 [Bryobacteraceae bacterium]|jgi:hypothetical protein|nr:hypothetical protein [Bryobacteraceae bacterium]